MTDKPWLEEPKKCHWINNDGQECLIIRHFSMGHLCGYVRADKYVNYTPSNLIEINVHGGITFSGPLPNYEGWWIGFDCAHYNDLIPFRTLNPFDTTFEIPKNIYRTFDYVQNEVNCMAKQVLNKQPNYTAIRDRFYNANIIVPRSLEEFIRLTNVEFDYTSPNLNIKEIEDEIIIFLCDINVARYPYEVKVILAEYGIRNPTLDKIIQTLTLTGESE